MNYQAVYEQILREASTINHKREICGAEQAESGISRERSIVETGPLSEEGWQSHGFGCTCPV